MAKLWFLRIGLVSVMTAAIVSVYVSRTSASAVAAEPIMAQMGMARSEITVTVKNLQPLSVHQPGIALNRTFSFGDECIVREDSPFVGLGQDGDRVLVRLRENPQSPRSWDADYPCPPDTLFWIHRQQFILSAGAYRRAMEKKSTQQTAEEVERAAIRRILDEQLARK